MHPQRSISPDPARFDALVIGGGPAGATTAWLLARAGWSVAVLECKSFPRRKVCGEYLSATNGPLFATLRIGEEFLKLSGPDVTRLGLACGRGLLTADLPRPPGAHWGRALSRERLDTLLLERAAAAGATIWQPYAARSLAREPDGFVCLAAPHAGQPPIELRAGLVVAAHGSWQNGQLPTQPPRSKPRPADLFAFKAHFTGSALPAGLMPLISFPGGYGGLVHADGGRTSLSCCLRRDHLRRLQWRGGMVGEAVLGWLLATCPALEPILGGAQRAGDWLAAGPIRPGIRGGYRYGVWQVGNAAGEAHPVVAEGISMALQSAWLVAERLIAAGPGAPQRQMESLGRDYAIAWKRAFAPRLRAAALVAHWAMHPAAVRAAWPLLARYPALLTWGARQSGKATPVVIAAEGL